MRIYAIIAMIVMSGCSQEVATLSHTSDATPIVENKIVTKSAETFNIPREISSSQDGFVVISYSKMKRENLFKTGSICYKEVSELLPPVTGDMANGILARISVFDTQSPCSSDAVDSERAYRAGVIYVVPDRSGGGEANQILNGYIQSNDESCMITKKIEAVKKSDHWEEKVVTMGCSEIMPGDR